jgi:hypothetical protein
MPLRKIVYPATRTLSVLAVQHQIDLRCEAAVPERPMGTVGAASAVAPSHASEQNQAARALD